MKPKTRIYNYKYVQFTVTSTEKEQIKNFCRIENHKTISAFMRKLVFDYMRKQLNPDIFLPDGNGSLNTLKFDKILENSKEILRNQDTILQREDSFEEMKQVVMRLHKLVENSVLSKEQEKIIQLLETNNSLSLRQIQEETNFAEEIIFKIISNMNLFKITSTGRFALR
ncbi:MAG: hypothetical protein ACFFA3_21430 [Promethearchaeota archaeon]|jgi:hypothetical protein